MLELWNAWNTAGNKKPGALSATQTKEVIERFKKRYIDRYRRSLSKEKQLTRKEKTKLVEGLAKDIEAHALIPGSIYVREDGRCSGWFADPEGGYPSVVEVRSQPYLITVWDDPVAFVRDFVRDENLTPYLRGWLSEAGVPPAAYAYELVESPQISPRRTLLSLKDLQRLSLDPAFEVIHAMRPAAPPAEQTDPLKQRIETDTRGVFNGALRRLAEESLFQKFGFKLPSDLSGKKVHFVHHEDLLRINTYRASWIQPADPDTIYIGYEFWHALGDPQREMLLAQEIFRSEALKAMPDPMSAEEKSREAALIIDPGKNLIRSFEDILKDYRIYDGVDRIELFITHPHGDHASYVANYVRGKMQANLVARPVPRLTEEIHLELGNRFTHEVTSYLLRPSRRVVTVIDMGGYKGEGADPLIETVNPHFRIGKKRLMKPVTVYADRFTAQTLDFRKKLASWQKEGLRVELKIFDEDRDKVTITDSDFNSIEVTAHRAFHLPREIGSSIYVVKKRDRAGRLVSTFSLVSEIGDAFPFSTGQKTIDEIAASDVIAIDGTNFSSGAVSPVPVRFQDNKITQFTDRLNRSWAMVTHLNTTMVGSVAEALEAARTLDPDIPIIIFAGKEGLEQLKTAYETAEDGTPLLKRLGDLYYFDSAAVRKDSRGAKIYFVNSMPQFNAVWKVKMGKDVRLQDVLPMRLRQLYASGRNVTEVGEYLEDWAKNPGMEPGEFIWLLAELQKKEWDIFSADDVIDSFTNRAKQIIRDYFSELRDAKQNYLGNPAAGKWVMERLLESVDAFVAERRARWLKAPKKDLPGILRDDVMAFTGPAVSFMEGTEERERFLKLIEALNDVDTLNVSVEGRAREKVIEESIAAVCRIAAAGASARKMPQSFIDQVTADLRERLSGRAQDWADFQTAYLPYLLLDDAQRYLTKQAGEKPWSAEDTGRLTGKIGAEMKVHRQAGAVMADHVLKKAFYRMLDDGAVPAAEVDRTDILMLLLKEKRDDPRIMVALIKLIGKDTPNLNRLITQQLLERRKGKWQLFDARLEQLHASRKGGLSKLEAQELLEACSAHPWGSPEPEKQWVLSLLDKCVSASSGNTKWLGLDSKDLFRQTLYAINHSRLGRWSAEQVQEVFEKIFDIKELSHDQIRELVLQFIASVPDKEKKLNLVGYLGAADKKDLRKYERRKGMRQKEQEDIREIEIALWELAKTGQGKALIIGSGHFGSAQHKATQLLNQIFDKRYAEVLIEGRPRTEGRQGWISGQLITREQMALLGKYRPIRVRHEHQWMSGHITFEEAAKLLELIYNARVRMGLVKGPLIPEKGVKRIAPEDLKNYAVMPMRVLFTTSSKLMTPDGEEIIKMFEEIGEEKRDIIETFGELFGVLEVGAGRKTINIGRGKWTSKQYGRQVPRASQFVRDLYDAMTRGDLPADLSGLVSSRKPAEFAEDIARIEKKETEGIYELLRQLERYFESQVLRLGLRIIMGYGSQRVIQEEEIGILPEGPEAQKQFAQLPLEAKGLYFQFARAVQENARAQMGEPFFSFVKKGMDRFFDRPPQFFDEDGKITASLEMLARRYTQPGFAKAAVWTAPMKRWAESHRVGFRIQLPAAGYEREKLFKFLRHISIHKIHQFSTEIANRLNSMGKKREFQIECQGFLLECRDGALTLYLTSDRPAASPRVPSVNTEPDAAAILDSAA